MKEFQLLSRQLNISISLPTFLFGLAIPWIWFFLPKWIFPSTLIFFLITIVWSLFTIEDLRSGLSQVAGNLFVFPYLILPFTLLAELQAYSPRNTRGVSGSLEILLVLLIVWISDSAAYFIGRKIGRHKITPRISPNKSLEGFLAGLIIPPLVIPWIGFLMGIEFSWIFLAVASLLVAFSAIMGDLFESVLKRGAGIKDTSSLIPGHGGILDRVDSLLLAFPAYFLMKLFFT